MGAVKDEMETTDLTKKKSVSDRVKDSLQGLVGKGKADPESATKFADMILAADAKLAELILIKQKDVTNEPGDVDYNRKALAHLRTMQFHLEAIADLANDYRGLRK